MQKEVFELETAEARVVIGEALEVIQIIQWPRLEEVRNEDSHKSR